MPKFHEKCPAPGCLKPGDFARGFCGRHWHDWRRACIENGSWGRGDNEPKFPVPPLPHWEYENPQGEQELAEQIEQREREKLKSEEEHHHDVE